MKSSYRVSYLLAAPLIVVVGLLAVFWGRRAVAFGERVHDWADSLKHGSGPVAIDVQFLPIYVDGEKIGRLDTVVVQRDRPGGIDSLRVVVRLRDTAAVERLAACRFLLSDIRNMDPTEYRHALSCASDSTGLVRFGRVAFGAGREAPLYVGADQVSCRGADPAASADCARREAERIREEIRREIRSSVREGRHEVRARVRRP